MKRNTKQGEVVLEVMRSAGRPLTPLEIHQRATQEIPRLGIATTYRHLKALSESNHVVGVDYPGQPPRYEWVDGQDKVHFACRSCDNVSVVFTVITIVAVHLGNTFDILGSG